MDKEEADFRKKINFMILNGIGGGLLTTFRPNEPLQLGSTFEYQSEKVFDELDLRRKLIIGELNKFSVQELREGFSDVGEPLTDHQKAWQTAQIAEIKTKYMDAWHWLLLPFQPDKYLANFDYWAKAAFLHLDEALWLCVGLEPLEEFRKKFTARILDRKNFDAVERHVLGLRELFVREHNPHNYNDRLSPLKILAWIKRVDLRVHPGFLRMLEMMADRTSNGPTEVSEALSAASEETDRFDPREKQSLAKLFVAMAITEYGYVPFDKKSPVPAEIVNIAAHLGLNVSDETVRKYLQMGARTLPKDWKPISN